MTRDDILELAGHMEWADAMVWATCLQSGAARADERIKGWLFHLHTVQRAFTSIWLGQDPALVPLASFPDVVALGVWGREGHAALQETLRTLDDERWGRRVKLPWAGRAIERPEAVMHPTLPETATQVALHSMHHRGQVNARLRELGAEPPLVDYIAWIWRGRPAPPWPRNLAAPEPDQSPRG